MPIIFDSEKRMFKLDTATSSYIIEIFKENYLVHLYYGAKIPDMNVSMLKYNGSFASFSPQNINIDDCRFSRESHGVPRRGRWRFQILRSRRA